MPAAMAGAGLTRRERISGDARFERIRREGASAGDGILFVRALANDAGRVRLGLAVGRQSGGAVRRTRLRRVIREAFRINKGRLPSGLDLLVSPRGGAAGARLEELGRSLAKLAGQVAGKIRGEAKGP